MSLRQFQPVDDRGPHFLWDDTVPRNDQFAVFDRRGDSFRRDARQRNQHQHSPLRLEHVNGRLPDRALQFDRTGLKTSRCRRSARASISNASDHIQLRDDFESRWSPQSGWKEVGLARTMARMASIDHRPRHVPFARSRSSHAGDDEDQRASCERPLPPITVNEVGLESGPYDIEVGQFLRQWAKAYRNSPVLTLAAAERSL